MEVGGVFRPIFIFLVYFSIVSFLSMIIFDTKSLYATVFSIKLDFKGKQTFLLLMHLRVCKIKYIFLYIETVMVFQWNLFSNIKYTHPNFYMFSHKHR